MKKKMYSSAPRRIHPYGLALEYTKDTVDPAPVFIYHEHDCVLYGVEMVNGFNEASWEALRTNPNAKLLISFIGDYYNASDLLKFKGAIRHHRVPFDRVWVLCMDKNFAEFSQKIMPGVNAGVYNMLLKQTDVPKQTNPDPSVRFSILSRNYRPWRFNFYLKLVAKGLLDKAIYSFHNYNPYTKDKAVFGFEQLGKDALALGHDLNNPTLRSWISGVPYDLPFSSRANKFSSATTKAINTAGINLLIESHYYVFEYWPEFKGTNPKDFVPGFLTEKTYKALLCARPFIAITTPYFLEDVRKLGFKTFGPYINEEYDNEEDDEKRMDMIVSEVERINNLSDTEYQELLANLADVAQHNRDLAIFMCDTNTWPWEWLKEYV